MTTQTKSAETNLTISQPTKKRTQIWPLILAAFLLLSLIGVAILISYPKGDQLANNRHALESISARYQRAADIHTASILADTQRALETISLRYQGMTDLYASVENANKYHVLEIISSRYQWLADLYSYGDNVDARRALEIISHRYQALADLYQAKGK